MRIACVGDNCIDRYGPPLGYALVGGNAVNVAVHMSRLGHDGSYFGAVGRDAAGAETARCLAAEGLNLDGLQWNETAPTAYTEIAVDAATGERRFVFEEFGATGGRGETAAPRARAVAGPSSSVRGEQERRMG